jgi:hypothetical protein
LDKTAVGLTNVDNTSDANKPVSTAGQTALNLKANLASPAFTGVPTAPTMASSDSSTTLATTAYVKSQAYLTSFSELDPKVGALTSGYVPKWGITSLVNGSIYDNGTNVGIGTSGPGVKLDVAGGIIRESGYSVSDAATDNLLVNGDFEMGNLSGWSGLDSVVNA